MSIHISGSLGAHAHPLAQERSPVKDFVLTAIRVTSVFATVVSAFVFLETGLIAAAVFFGIALTCSIISLSMGRSHRHAHAIRRAADPILVVQQRPSPPPVYQTVRNIRTSPASQHGYGFGHATPAAAPQPYPTPSGRDAVGSRQYSQAASTPSPKPFTPAAAAPQPRPNSSGRDEVGSRQQNYMASTPSPKPFTPAAPAPQPHPTPSGRDAVGGRQHNQAASMPPAKPFQQAAAAPQPRPTPSGRDEVGGRQRQMDSANSRSINNPTPTPPPSGGRDEVGKRRR